MRPTLDDVESLSRGKRSRNRRSGSRATPHRLIESERKAFEVSKRNGFVSLRGSGWRKERGASPLLNTYRQRCDAEAKSTISFQKGMGNDAVDTVSLDVSTLRNSQEMKRVVHESFSKLNPELILSVQCLYSNNKVHIPGQVLIPELDFYSSPIHMLPKVGFDVTFYNRTDAKSFCKEISTQ